MFQKDNVFIEKFNTIENKSFIFEFFNVLWRKNEIRALWLE